MRAAVELPRFEPIPTDLAEVIGMPNAARRSLEQLRREVIALRMRTAESLFERGDGPQAWDALLRNHLEHAEEHNLLLPCFVEIGELLEPILPLYGPIPAYAPTALSVDIAGRAAFRLPVETWEEIAYLGELLVRLHTGVTPPEMRHAIGGDAKGRDLVHALIRHRCLEPSEPAPDLPPMEPGQIVDLGRGSLLFSTGPGRLLVDPWPATTEILRIEGGLQGVVLTEARLERMPLEICLLLPRTTPLFLPPSPNVQAFVGLLKALGFTSVHPCAYGTPARVDGGSITYHPGAQVTLRATSASIQICNQHQPWSPAQPDRIFVPLRPTRRPALLRSFTTLFQPMNTWFDRVPGPDWSTLAKHPAALWAFETGDRYVAGGTGQLVAPNLPYALKNLPGVHLVRLGVPCG